MAVTVLGNTAAALSGKFLSVDGIKIGSLTRTDAQIKALPGLYFTEVVAAVTGKLLIPMWGLAIGNFTAGAYTNVQGDTAYLGMENQDGNAAYLSYAENITSEGKAAFSNFFGTADKVSVKFSPLEDNSASQGNTLSRFYLVSGVTGNVGFSVYNGALGNFTGGNSANTLVIYIAYAEVTVP